jgi:hypothetical protein
VRLNSTRSWVLFVAGLTTILLSAGVVLYAPVRRWMTPSAAAAVPIIGSDPAPWPTSTTPAPTSTSPLVTAPAEEQPTYPEVGGGTYRIAPGDPTIVGRRGELLRYRVAVEKDIAHLDILAFADTVAATYGAAQGWTAGGQWRFQRVGPGEPADFVLYLVTPGTRDSLCQEGYDRYTSCRNGDRVVLNVARWAHGVPAYGASLAVYREYMINHETGHRLGFGHELCPGTHDLAPVMQQQTLGLHGCVANAWPYPDGRSYHGVFGAYPDLPPRAQP